MDGFEVCDWWFGSSASAFHVVEGVDRGFYGCPVHVLEELSHPVKIQSSTSKHNAEQVYLRYTLARSLGPGLYHEFMCLSGKVWIIDEE